MLFSRMQRGDKMNPKTRTYKVTIYYTAENPCNLSVKDQLAAERDIFTSPVGLESLSTLDLFDFAAITTVKVEAYR